LTTLIYLGYTDNFMLNSLRFWADKLGAEAEVDSMQKHQPLSQSDVTEIFQLLGLTTQQDRQRVLSLADVREQPSPQKALYITRLSNSSAPVCKT
jgi:hypothetical protein